MLKSLTAAVFAIVALVATPSLATTADRGSKDEAQAMVDRAIALYQAEGAEALVAAVNDTSNTAFHDRDLYVFVFDNDGVTVAHGANANLVGKNLMGLKDVDGKAFLHAMRDVAVNQGSGWVDYKWPNPVTKAVEAKTSYVKMVSDTIWLGVGVYQ